jgi:hypothetical protein
MITVSHYRWIVQSIMVFCFFVPKVFAQNQQEILNLISGRHRAAIESIRCVSCTVTIEEGADALHLSVQGQYWRSGDWIRIHEKHAKDNYLEDVLAKGATATSLVTNATASGSISGHSAFRLAAAELTARVNVWDSMLLDFEGNGFARVNIEEFLSLPSTRWHAERVREQGKELLYVNRTFDDPPLGETHLELWFDPEVNYLVRKQVRSCTKGSHSSRGVSEIEDFLEVSPGLYFPVKRRTKGYRDGKWVWTTHSAR